MPTQPQILIIDDTPENLRLLVSMLGHRGYDVRPANNGAMGLQAAQQHPPDIILLDIGMPEMDGFEVCRRLKATPQLADIPVLFISARSEMFDKVLAFEVGGVDYITKPFEPEEILARLRTHLKLRARERELETLLKKQQTYFMQVAEIQSEFFNAAVHDLRNPLSLIMGNTYLLGELVDDERGTHLVERIEHATQFMNMLITDILDLARIESGIQLHIEETLLAPFLRGVYQDYVTHNRNMTYRFDVAPTCDDTIVMMDIKRMERALANLLSNATKFTPSGGTVTFHAHILNDTHYVIEVRDTGIGIPQEAISHLFEKFYRVPSNDNQHVDSTGLGLAIVKAVIEQHRGIISVESTLDVGTTFTLTLPIDEDNI